MNEAGPEQLEGRVLVLAPTARDAATSQELLAAADVRAVRCASIDDVCREAARGAGAAIVTAEAVLRDRDGQLAAWLRAQPPWSDFPLIVLTPPGRESPKLLPALETVGHMTLMQRPVEVAVFVGAVRSALRDRHRQYAVRDLLEERRRAAEALDAERERYRVTLASIGDAVVATDTQGRVTFLNPVAEHLTGWGANALGRPLDEVVHIVHAATRQPVPNPALRALQEGMVIGLANHSVLVGRDGTERPLDDSAAPIRGAGDEVVGAVLVFRDMTERQRAEQAVRAQEQRARDILESVTDAFFALDRDWRFTYVNRQAEQVLGRTPGDLLGKTLWAEYPGLAGSAFERAYRNAMNATGDGAASSITAYYPDHQRWYEVRTHPAPEGIGVYFRNVTEQAEAERTLRESEARYRRAAAEAAQAAEANAKFRVFFEQGTNFAGVLALDGTVVEANRLCIDGCGLTREAVLGRPFWECGWWNRSPALMETVRAATFQAAAGRMFRSEVDYFLAGGAERVVDLILAPVTDDAGRVLFVAATGSDITDRKQMEQSLREADRKKDDFIALLAHELRNPLAPIRNGLQVMRLASGDPSAVTQARAMMERQLGHMVRLIDDLLDISRISRNKMELRRTRVLLADIVGSAVETARPLIDAGGHTLTVTLPPEPVFLDADLTRLAQVFSNLLSNSAKYTEWGGRIWLAAERCSDGVIVSVRDTGIGIPGAALPTIFDMFSQVDRSIERSTGGLGIGLALVKGLVEMHGGTVAVASAGQGKGSVFTVKLPVLESVANAHDVATPEHGATARGPKRRMMVVDDNRDSATSMALMLELLGNEVVTAHDGLEAVEEAERFRPDFILMDVGMPRLNGLDATRRIRAQSWGKALTIVALTGWGQDGDRAQSHEAGCDGHLVKPVNLSELQNFLQRLSAERNQNHAGQES